MNESSLVPKCWLLGLTLLGALPTQAVAQPKQKAALKGHTGFVTAVAFSPGGKTLASGSLDKTIKLWDVATGREKAVLKGHISEVMSVAFSPDGKLLASGSDDKTIKL